MYCYCQYMLNTRMPQQFANSGDVYFFCVKVGGKGVAQHVGCYPFGDACYPGIFTGYFLHIISAKLASSPVTKQVLLNQMGCHEPVFCQLFPESTTAARYVQP